MNPLSFLPWWAQLAIAAAIATAVYVSWEHYIANPYRKEGGDAVQKKWDADNAARRAITTTVLAEQARNDKGNEDANDRRKANADGVFSVLALRAAAGPSRACVRSAASARLLDDTVRAANADRPATAAADGKGEARADPVPRPAEGADVTYDSVDDDTWKVKAGEAYRDSFDTWLACRAREDSLRVTANRLLGAAP